MCDSSFAKLTCLVCDYEIHSGYGYDIFDTPIPNSDTSLAKSIQKIIRKNIQTLSLQSTVLCGKCFCLVEELKDAEGKCEKIQREILSCFLQNSKKYGYKICERTYENVACQTDMELLMDAAVMLLQMKKQFDDGPLVDVSCIQENECEKTLVELSVAQQDITTNAVYGYSDLRDDEGRSEEVKPEAVDSAKRLVQLDKPTENELEASLSENKDKVSKKSKHACGVCGKLCRRPCELNQHMLSHSGAKPYSCQKCGKFFSTKSGAEIHCLKQHTETTSIVFHDPTVSADKTVDSAVQKKPSSVDTDDDFEWKLETPNVNGEEITSPEADSSAVKSDSVKQKATKEQASKARSRRQSKGGHHRCLSCGKVCRTPGELRSHEATHSAEKPFICEVCGQGYKHKYALETHLAIHKGENPFRCSFCNKVFTQKGGLQRHLPMHTGELPFQCDLCGKRFVHHTSFRVHKLVHSGEKQFKCERCGLALLSGSHLKRHMRIHTGEKPFQCETCLKKFAERYNLYAHMRTHTGTTKIYKCSICGLAFDRKNKCDEHTSTHKWTPPPTEYEYAQPSVPDPSQAPTNSQQPVCLPPPSQDIVQVQIHVNENSPDHQWHVIFGKPVDIHEEEKLISSSATSHMLSIDGRIVNMSPSRQCLTSSSNQLLTLENVAPRLHVYPDTSTL